MSFHVSPWIRFPSIDACYSRKKNLFAIPILILVWMIDLVISEATFFHLLFLLFIGFRLNIELSLKLVIHSKERERAVWTNITEWKNTTCAV